MWPFEVSSHQISGKTTRNLMTSCLTYSMTLKSPKFCQHNLLCCEIMFLVMLRLQFGHTGNLEDTKPSTLHSIILELVASSHSKFSISEKDGRVLSSSTLGHKKKVWLRDERKPRGKRHEDKEYDCVSVMSNQSQIRAILFRLRLKPSLSAFDGAAIPQHMSPSEESGNLHTYVIAEVLARADIFVRLVARVCLIQTQGYARESHTV